MGVCVGWVGVGGGGGGGQQQPLHWQSRWCGASISFGRRHLSHPCPPCPAALLPCPLHCFCACLQRCLLWEPAQRMTPDQALQHPWILTGG